MGKTIFVSGATGFIGSRLVMRLADDGATIHALYRSEVKADPIRRKEVLLFKGDILDEDSVMAAMKGCDQAFHVAAFAGVWSKDPTLIHRLNVDGALNVINAARLSGTKRVVVTSTAGILGPSEGEAVNEDTPTPTSFFTAYEASKSAMEKQLGELTGQGPEVVIVNPTRVYGPGVMSESNGVTRMIGQYLNGKWRLIPGDGKSSGNYVHVEDVVSGHLLAMEKGDPCQRYVLGGDNISYNRLFEITREIGRVNFRLFHMPLWLMLTAARLMGMWTKITGMPPLILPGLVRKFNHNWIVSSRKAIKKLGYEPMDAREGIGNTIAWLQKQS
ncbi:MAG: NAD-dependent epimerase/dehydratase family protein [Bacteroidetes bacterium]|nr:NAD-dependent epimerase/dehydratase family protein [Bacteroidota bacterium]